MKSHGDPMETFGRVRGMVHRFLSDLSPEFQERGAQVPALNAWQDEEAYHVEVEVPGYSIPELEVTLSGRELTLRGERQTQPPGRETSPLRNERPLSRFWRTLALPAEVDPVDAKATLERGLLTLTFRKSTTSTAHRIEIRPVDGSPPVTGSPD